MSGITVRQASVNDLNELAVLFDAYRQFYGAVSDVLSARDFLFERFQYQQSIVFIAHEHESPVGFTQLYSSFSSVSMKRLFVLNDLFVVDSARKQNIGSLLLNAATDYAHKLKAVRLTLTTAKTNEIAQALYEKQGWKKEENFLVYHYPLKG